MSNVDTPGCGVTPARRHRHGVLPVNPEVGCHAHPTSATDSDDLDGQNQDRCDPLAAGCPGKLGHPSGLITTICCPLAVPAKIRWGLVTPRRGVRQEKAKRFQELTDLPGYSSRSGGTHTGQTIWRISAVFLVRCPPVSSEIDQQTRYFRYPTTVFTTHLSCYAALGSNYTLDFNTFQNLRRTQA